MLDMNTLMTRAQFYDQAWFGGSPLADYLRKMGLVEHGLRDEIIRGTGAKMRENQRFTDDFNTNYNRYVGVFNATAQAKAQAAQVAKDRIDRVAALKIQSANRISDAKNSAAAEVARINQESAQRVADINRTSSTVANSLRILGTVPSQQAPTAQTSRRQARTSGAGTTQSSLRIGSTGSALGAGLNIGG